MLLTSECHTIPPQRLVSETYLLSLFFPMVRSVALLTIIVVALALLGKAIGYLQRPRARPLVESRLNNPELQRAWKKFAQAVQTNDLPALQQLSAACIQCSDCVTNTDAEATAFEAYQKKHPDTWDDALYDSLSFVPAEVFWHRDGHLVFDPKTKSRLLDPAKLQFGANDHTTEGYVAPCLILPAQAASTRISEVLLTYIDPSRQGEGMQQAFIFVKTEQGYKFCGYFTIP